MLSFLRPQNVSSFVKLGLQKNYADAALVIRTHGATDWPCGLPSRHTHGQHPYRRRQQRTEGSLKCDRSVSTLYPEPSEQMLMIPTAAALAVASSATRSANSVTSAATQHAASVASAASGTTLTMATPTTANPTPASSFMSVSSLTAASLSTLSTASDKAAAASSSGSTSTSSSSTSSAAAASSGHASASAAAQSGLSSSSKVGIGLGVPLGVIMASAIMGFFIYRHKRYKQNSRFGHLTNIRGGGSSANGDVENKETTVGSWDEGRFDTPPSDGISREPVGRDGESVVGAIPEVHGEHIPPYSTELGGTAGVQRSELE